MDWLAKVRYGFAVLLYASLPAAILYWLVIHPFVGFWRRLGVTATYLIVGIFFLAVVVLLASQHQRVLATSYPFSWPLAILGLILYAVAAAIDVSCRRHLKFSILAGVPEVGKDPGRLLTEGLYSRVRNPRYLAMILGCAGFALILNYPAVYLVVALSLPALYAIILLEERELKERFGAEYELYLERVPRLVPRLR